MCIIFKKRDLQTTQIPFDEKRLINSLSKVYLDFQSGIPKSSFDNYINKIVSFIKNKKEVFSHELAELLIREAEVRTSIESPKWELFASRIYLNQIYSKASVNRAYPKKDKYGSFLGLLNSLGSKGIYNKVLFEKYTEGELEEAGTFINPDNDLLFNYNGLHLLMNRYAFKVDGEIHELPQERWLVIALWLMQDEGQYKRLDYVKEAYWALSNLYMTVATPTLANAGGQQPQLSSCFIDTVGDDLISIYESNTDLARVSKFGGGIGAYLGFIRSQGSSIRGVKGASGGVVPWIKQLNNTAVSVDQLGTRKGAIAVYLDIFHKDIEDFLDLRLNNGDQRMRAHDIFNGVCIPDLFMKQVEKRAEWFLFDPYEVNKVSGYYLQDYWGEEFEKRYWECVDNTNISKRVVPAIDIMKRIMKSQLETGTPFMFYRDTVNRANPNKHTGMIYSTNLCTEIMQNMSPTQYLSEVMDEDGNIQVTKKSGDFVVCNLSSINLSKWDEFDHERLIDIQVRMLDNTIDINQLPVKQAEHTNKRYRAIGLGTFGLHEYLAKRKIKWEDSGYANYVIYRDIYINTHYASAMLAKEKGAYPLFEGSDVQFSNSHIQDREHPFGDSKARVTEDLIDTYGIRNGYLMAIAPNGSTAQICGTTASIDPIYQPFYYEEKKDYRRPIVAPNLTKENEEYYKSAFKIDQISSIKINAIRQKYIDQGISFNIYVPSFIPAKKLLEIHMTAWQEGLKSTYYVRSQDVEVEECGWCSA